MISNDEVTNFALIEFGAFLFLPILSCFIWFATVGGDTWFVAIPSMYLGAFVGSIATRLPFVMRSKQALPIIFLTIIFATALACFLFAVMIVGGMGELKSNGEWLVESGHLTPMGFIWLVQHALLGGLCNLPFAVGMTLIYKKKMNNIGRTTDS